MRTTLKLTLSVLVAGALVFSGIAWAQSDEAADDAPVEERPAYARIVEALEPLIADGTIDEAQAEAVAGVLTEALPDRPHHRPGDRMRVIGEETADFLGITVDELRESVRDGATLAEVAEANGSSAEALVDFLVGNVADRLDEAVAAGTITEEQAAERLEQATEHITDLVNGDLPERPEGFGRGGPGGRFAPGGDTDGADA